MKTRFWSRSLSVAAVVSIALGFALFALVSSGQLNAATLRSIDGPLNSEQIAALQLSNALNVVAGSIVCGALFATISLLRYSRGQRVSE